MLDYSKQRIDSETIALLCQLARECELDAWIEKMFSGERVNSSENRAALHTALRLPADNQLQVDGSDIVSGIHNTLARMQQIEVRDKILGPHGDALKIAITAPPVEGKANAHLIKFLSKRLKVPKSAITIASGELSRDKVVDVDGITVEHATHALLSE